MKQPWITPLWICSWRNFASKGIERFSYPKEVRFLDMTLETDGEDMPGIGFTLEEKIKIARAVVDLGVEMLAVRAGWGKAGRPLPQDIEDYLALSKAGTGARLIAFCGTSRDDIDLARRYDAAGVVVQGASSEVRLRLRGINHEQVITETSQAMEYAKDHGLRVGYMPTDTPRANASFLRRLLRSVMKRARFDSLIVSDSVGCTSPFGILNIVDEVRRIVRVPIELHCHNDFGLATANAFAGVAAGASVVHTTINGMGERAGLVALEEIALALRVLRGIDTGISFEKLTVVSKLVSDFSGYSTRRNKPVVGDYMMAEEIEAGVGTVLSMRKEDFMIADLPYPPELVGNRFRVSMGPKTGENGVKWMLREKGLAFPEDQIPRLASEVRLLARRVKRPLTDGEFMGLLEKVKSAPS